jgi:hypothetical protein
LLDMTASISLGDQLGYWYEELPSLALLACVSDSWSSLVQLTSRPELFSELRQWFLGGSMRSSYV